MVGRLAKIQVGSLFKLLRQPQTKPLENCSGIAYKYSKKSHKCRIIMNIFTVNAQIVYDSVKVALIWLFIAYIASYASGVLANQKPMESHATIQQTAKIFLEEMTNSADNSGIELTIKDLDKRLRLRKCDSPLQASLPPGAKTRGRMLVKVSCSAPVNWKVFVSGSIDEYADIIVAARTIPRKSIITRKDVVIKRLKVTPYRLSPLMDMKDVVGASTKRQLRKDMPLFENSICMVCRGDSVQITARSQFFSINMEGIALQDASLGETTMVRNTQSKRSFNAKVVSKNNLEVSLTSSN